MGGRLHAVNRSVVLGDFTGFSVRRRLLSREKGASHVRGDLVVHDGTRQLVVRARWVEGAELHDRTLDAIIDSIRVV